MANFTTVRNGIAANLETIDGLRVHAKAPDTITGATALVLPGEGTFVDYDSSMDGDSEDMSFRIVLLVPRRADVTAQSELDGYLDKTGAQSVFAAVTGTAVAGTQYVSCGTARDYEDFTYAGERFLGCTFDVEVGAV